MRCLYVLYIVLLAFIIVSCGSMTKSLVTKQEWSENYAAMEGVQATTPEMIDGNWRTIGETETPIDSEGSTHFTEAVIKLPEVKSIRRVVIYTTNLENFVVYAIEDDGETWKTLQEIKNNKEKKLDLKVMANTDQIRVRVRKTSDDARIPGQTNRWRSVNRASGKIGEIEIYGLVEQGEELVAEVEEKEIEGAGVAAEFVAPEDFTMPATEQAPASEKTVMTEQKPGVAVQPKPTVQKKPPAAVSLESPQTTYALAVPIPVKVNIMIGPNDLVVLEDQMTDEMLFTKMLVKNAAGEAIACSKPTPKLSPKRPYRASGRQVDVRVAKTLEADSDVAIDIPDLLEYYPIAEPGTYTVQFSMNLGVHNRFVGRYQTQIEDLEAQIRDINTTPGLAQTDKASVTKEMRDELERLKQKKDYRYIIAGTRGKVLKLSSNVLELVIQ